MTIERDERPKSIGEVSLEPVSERVGWAVFTGVEGEEPHFHAFFARREDAARYAFGPASKAGDEEGWLFDPGIAPAAIIDGEIFAANHYDDELSAGVLLRAAGVHGEDADRFREEATPRVVTRSMPRRGGAP